MENPSAKARGLFLVFMHLKGSMSSNDNRETEFFTHISFNACKKYFLHSIFNLLKTGVKNCNPAYTRTVHSVLVVQNTKKMYTSKEMRLLVKGNSPHRHSRAWRAPPRGAPCSRAAGSSRARGSAHRTGYRVRRCPCHWRSLRASCGSSARAASSPSLSPTKVQFGKDAKM